MFAKQSSVFLNSFLYQNHFIDVIIYSLAQVLPFILFGIVIVYFLFIKKDMIAFTKLFLVALSSWGFSEIFKLIFSHPRPFIALTEITPLFTFGGTDSFPSGHATIFSALALATFFEHKKMGLFFGVCAIVIGVARVISGVHYVQDILAGFVLGLLLVVVSYSYLGILRNKS